MAQNLTLQIKYIVIKTLSSYAVDVSVCKNLAEEAELEIGVWAN